MEKSRANVTICGSEYVLSGEKSEEKIKEIARYVDEELRRTSKALNSNPNYRAAVLTAINLAEKLMDNSDLLLKLQTENHQLDNDVKHYITLWEGAKKQVTDLKDQINSEANKQVQDTARVRDLEQKCSELESAYFDLQMENVNLKNEMRNLKRISKQDEF
ncbi:MAG: cell division protein ZapA [Mogibacterium sp.]|nr:cell division protein ZapA [Mogibacterium sp.]